VSLTEPIVEGAYYERADGCVMGPARPWGDIWELAGNYYRSEGNIYGPGPIGMHLIRRVWIVPTDPAEVVAEKLGVTP